jgi:hypothetical protein
MSDTTLRRWDTFFSYLANRILSSPHEQEQTSGATSITNLHDFLSKTLGMQNVQNTNSTVNVLQGIFQYEPFQNVVNTGTDTYQAFQYDTNVSILKNIPSGNDVLFLHRNVVHAEEYKPGVDPIKNNIHNMSLRAIGIWSRGHWYAYVRTSTVGTNTWYSVNDSHVYENEIQADNILKQEDIKTSWTCALYSKTNNDANTPPYIPRGMKNEGTVCYFNTACQMLLAVPQFRNVILEQVAGTVPGTATNPNSVEEDNNVDENTSIPSRMSAGRPVNNSVNIILLLEELLCADITHDIYKNVYRHNGKCIHTTGRIAKCEKEVIFLKKENIEEEVVHSMRHIAGTEYYLRSVVRSCGDKHYTTNFIWETDNVHPQEQKFYKEEDEEDEENEGIPWTVAVYSTVYSTDNIIGGVLNSYLQSYIEIQDNERTTFKMILALLIWLGDNTNIDIRGFEELLKGAHIVIYGDNGKLFLEMCKHFKRVKSSYGSALSSKRWPPQSSHSSEIPEEIQDACPLHGNDQLRLGHGIIFNCDKVGNLIHEEANDTFDILMGIRGATPSKDYAGNSWVQLEYARLSGTALKERAVNAINHGWAWVKYKVRGNNQGPFGESSYTETGPTGPYVLKMNERGGVPSSVINDNIHIPYEKFLNNTPQKNRGIDIVGTNIRNAVAGMLVAVPQFRVNLCKVASSTSHVPSA